MMLILLLIPVSAFAATGTLTVTVNQNKYERGETIVISGNSASSDPIALKVVTPTNSMLYVDQITATDGEYAVSIDLPVDQALTPDGRYIVSAGQGSASVTAQFTIGKQSVTPSDPSSPSPGENSCQSFGNSNEGIYNCESIIAGKSEDGQYQVSYETVKKAVDAMMNPLVIAINNNTASDDIALQIPANAIAMLQQGKIDLVIQTSNSNVYIPSSALQVNMSEHSQLRMKIATGLNEATTGLIEQSLQGNESFKQTDIVFTASIELVSGTTVTKIEQFNRPIEVTLQLTAEQQKAIEGRNVAVYYVDGKQIEHIGGKVSNGKVTFTTSHFSTFIMLEQLVSSFLDLPSNHWVAEAVYALVEQGIIKGVDADHFAPARSITRAEFVTLIMRAYEAKQLPSITATAISFTDISDNQYYTDYVKQAAAIEIMQGYNNKFRPTDEITREEAVVALIRAEQYFDYEAKTINKAAFKDEAQVSSWAKEAVNKAQSIGLVEGSNGHFKPKQAVSRAEVAMMLHRLLSSNGDN